MFFSSINKKIQLNILYITYFSHNGNNKSYQVHLSTRWLEVWIWELGKGKGPPWLVHLDQDSIWSLQEKKSAYVDPID